MLRCHSRDEKKGAEPAMRFQAAKAGAEPGSACYLVELVRPGKKMQVFVGVGAAGSMLAAKNIAAMCHAKSLEGWGKADLLSLRDGLIKKLAEERGRCKGKLPPPGAPSALHTSGNATAGPRLFRKTSPAKVVEAAPVSNVAEPGRSRLRKLNILRGKSDAPSCEVAKAHPMATQSTSSTSGTLKKGARKHPEDAEFRKVTSPKKMKRGSVLLQEKEDADLAEAHSRSRHVERSKDEAFRDLFGNIVLVRAPSRCLARVAEADLRPWRDLEPSDVEHLSCDEVSHYERLQQLSTKRPRPERIARLVHLAQKNTLLAQLKGTANDGPSSLAEFLALPNEQRLMVNATELKKIERLAFLGDNEYLSMGERRDRLVEMIRDSRRGGAQVRSMRSFAELLAAGAAKGGAGAGACKDIMVSETIFVIGQKVQRRDEGDDWGTGYVTSVEPLMVTVSSYPSAQGHEWQEVRPMPAEVTFELGEKVLRRDDGEDWAAGYVTSLDPLLVTVGEDASAVGLEWREVRRLSEPAEASSAVANSAVSQ